MGLEKDEIAGEAVAHGAEEVVEAGLEDFRRGGVAREMAAEFARGAIGAHDHGERVPAND